MYKLFIMGLSLLFSLTLGAEKVSFSEQIRPLLNRNCTGCHGGVKEAGGFSLLYKEKAFGKTHHGIGIVPGKPSESMLYKVITSPPEIFDHNKKKNRRLEHMPMEKEPLSAEEIALIKRWIEEGAVWEEHWAYNAPKKEELPKVSSDWPKNRIDYFILNKLNEKKLAPSEEADRGILLRRLYLDLTGLPPKHEDLQEFIADNSPNAYEKQVDKLLKSPKYGEKWAGMWLDLARYSDTQGYEKDSPRTIYRYRDEVINAFNKDTPYNQFVIEQMAGDLLPNATEHQKILTAFHRNTMTNTEGGTNDEEFRVAAVLDRVNTTWEALMGTSYGCVQCHTHPYDPFTHEEYFQFMAFLNNTTDADRNDESPKINTPDIYQQKQLDEWQKSLDQISAKVDAEKSKIQQNFDARFTAAMDKLETPQLFVFNATDIKTKSDFALTQNEDKSFSTTKGAKKKAVFTISGTVESDKLNLLQIDALKKKSGFGHAGNFVLSGLSLKIKKQQKASGRYLRVEHLNKGILSLAEVQVMSQGKNIALKKPATQSSTAYSGDAKRAVDGNTSGDYGQNTVTHTDGNDTPWWEVDLQVNSQIDEIFIFNRNQFQDRLNNIKVTILDDSRNTVWSGSLKKAQNSNQLSISEHTANFNNATATFEQQGFPAKDALDKNKDKGWALAGSKNDIETAWFNMSESIKLDKGDQIELKLSFESKYDHHVLADFNIKLGYGKVQNANFKLMGYKDKKPADLGKGDKEFIINSLVKEGPAAKIFAQQNDLQNKIKNYKVATTPIMQELPQDKRRKTHVFVRGNWEDLAEEVKEGTPEVLHAFDSKWPKNRLGMAYWMTDSKNPLFARVAVNRLWEQIFGIGIVETLEDFGSQGIKPTHPKLLDDLAYRFMHEHKWSMKSMLKEMVMSTTYKQTSDTTEKTKAIDPFNQYYSHGPRFRLSAEQIRDQALAVSGLISDKMFGPSVMPFQPEGVWMTVYNGGKWVTSKNGDQYRRALYTYWKRTSPYPSMEAFDTPSREVCKVRRIRTNTPLQALVTLNDPVYMECAENLGKVIKRQSGDLDSKLEFAFEKAVCRKPKAIEKESLKKLFTEVQRDFGKSEDEAWTLVANVIMNLDEFLIKR
ncbi:MAG: DUF1553 domain-containing protein [Lentisphaeraceae bacterium]|nr:DUF1553 domain-containing protein [Lentisphaeraceae bacterium]